jgi:hypothetical protein
VLVTAPKGDKPMVATTKPLPKEPQEHPATV